MENVDSMAEPLVAEEEESVKLQKEVEPVEAEKEESAPESNKSVEIQPESAANCADCRGICSLEGEPSSDTPNRPVESSSEAAMQASDSAPPQDAAMPEVDKQQSDCALM